MEDIMSLMKSGTFYFYNWPLKNYNNIGILSIKPMCHTIVSKAVLLNIWTWLLLISCYLNNLKFKSNQEKNISTNCQ